jgi:hypothetical protein
MNNLELARQIYSALEKRQFDMDKAGFIAVIESTLNKVNQIAALQAEVDGLRAENERYQELYRLARDVADHYRSTSCNIGRINTLIEYIDNIQ